MNEERERYLIGEIDRLQHWYDSMLHVAKNQSDVIRSQAKVISDLKSNPMVIMSE